MPVYPTPRPALPPMDRQDHPSWKPTFKSGLLFKGCTFFIQRPDRDEPDEQEEYDRLMDLIKAHGGKTYKHPHPRFVTHILIPAYRALPLHTDCSITNILSSEFGDKAWDDIKPWEWSMECLVRHFAEVGDGEVFDLTAGDEALRGGEREGMEKEVMRPKLAVKPVLLGQWVDLCIEAERRLEGDDDDWAGCLIRARYPEDARKRYIDRLQTISNPTMIIPTAWSTSLVKVLRPVRTSTPAKLVLSTSTQGPARVDSPAGSIRPVSTPAVPVSTETVPLDPLVVRPHPLFAHRSKTLANVNPVTDDATAGPSQPALPLLPSIGSKPITNQSASMLTSDQKSKKRKRIVVFADPPDQNHAEDEAALGDDPGPSEVERDEPVVYARATLRNTTNIQDEVVLRPKAVEKITVSKRKRLAVDEDDDEPDFEILDGPVAVRPRDRSPSARSESTSRGLSTQRTPLSRGCSLQRGILLLGQITLHPSNHSVHSVHSARPSPSRAISTHTPPSHPHIAPVAPASEPLDAPIRSRSQKEAKAQFERDLLILVDRPHVAAVRCLTDEMIRRGTLKCSRAVYQACEGMVDSPTRYFTLFRRYRGVIMARLAAG